MGDAPGATGPGAAPTEPPPLARALADIVGAMLALPDLEQLLTRLAELAAGSVGEGSSCGITISSDGRTFTVASSDARAMQLDEVQYAGGDGPCLQTLRTGQAVSVPDLTDETRWGDYPTHAMTHGVRSSLSLPLIADGTPTGALNLYAAQPDVFTPDHVRAATVIAAAAAGAIAMALRLGAQVILTEQMQTALSTRAVIDQAIGIIIRDRRCTPDEAFTFLRTTSQQRNVRLHQVATQVVNAFAQTRPVRETPPPG